MRLFIKIIKMCVLLLLITSLSIGQASGAVVTFQVDMYGHSIAPDGVFLAGGEWHQNRQAMVEPADGGTIWTLSIFVENGDHLYKFQNGAGNYENVPAQCGHGQWLDRLVSVAGYNIEIDVTCFGSCSVCPTPDQSWRTAVFAHDEWKFILPYMELNSEWNTINYNDSQWLESQGGFGYSDGDDGTEIAVTNSVFIRKIFTIDNVSDIANGVLSADYDDGYVAYLNGMEVSRSDNLNHFGAQVPFDANTSVDHEAMLYDGGFPDNILIDSLALESILVNGPNVLAVQIHNVDINSSDMSSNFFLTFKLRENFNSYRTPPSWFHAPVDYSVSNLPIISIDTYGQSIPDEPRIPAYMGVIDNISGVNHVEDPFNGYYGAITIEKRGNSSQNQPKPPYRFETVDSDGENNNVEILGMPAENDWVLYAPWQDKTLVRNVLIYELSNEIDRYASRTRFVELFLNGEYQGVYVLMEKIKRDSDRIAISKLNPDEISGDDLTGGYILKFDWSGTGDNNGWFESPNDGIRYNYHYPKPDEIADEQEDYIQDYIYNFEEVMLSEDYTNNLTGYPSILDIDSFIDFILLQELAKNVDAYRLSTYIYKDKASIDNKLHAGPVWDFNHGFGNCNYGETWDPAGWLLDYNPEGGDQMSFWWELLWADENFRHKAAERYTELRSSTFSNSNINSIIDSVVNQLGGAVERNFNRWPLIGAYAWPNYYVFDSYDEEIIYLKSWTEQRLQWMDEQILLLSSVNRSEIVFGSQIYVYPNPFNNELTFKIKTNNKDIKSLDIYDIQGKKVRTLDGMQNKQGVTELRWDASDEGGRKVGSGLYIFRFDQDMKINTGIITLVK